MTKLQQFSATTQLVRAWAAGAVLMLPAIWKGDLKGCVRILSAQENPKNGTDLCHLLLDTEAIGNITVVGLQKGADTQPDRYF